MNYTELSDAIQAYTNNTDSDFVAEIPVFVKQAEQRINNAVQIANLRKNMTGNLQAGNKYIPCPFDFLSAYSLALYAALRRQRRAHQGSSRLWWPARQASFPGCTSRALELLQVLS
jgi:hypothetical protein